MDALPIASIDELDADTLAVFGDELQQFGDPHGELIARMRLPPSVTLSAV